MALSCAGHGLTVLVRGDGWAAGRGECPAGVWFWPGSTEMRVGDMEVRCTHQVMASEGGEGEIVPHVGGVFPPV